MVSETIFGTPTGTVAITDALAMGDGNRGHDSARAHVSSAAACDGPPRKKSSRPGVCSAPRRRTVRSPARRCRRWNGGVGVRRAGPLFPVALTIDESRSQGNSAPPRPERGLVLHHAKRAETGTAKVGAIRDRGTIRRHRVGVESWSEFTRPTWVRGETLVRTTADGAPGTLVCTDRCDLRGGDDIELPEAVGGADTATTATPVSGTLPSPSQPCGWPPAPTRPTSSSTT